MSQELKGIYKLGGISFIISGILFFVKYLLDLMAGPPPSSGAEILAWRASGELPLAFTVEVLFFAGVSLVPGVIALYYSLANLDRSKAAVGCGIIAVVIPITRQYPSRRRACCCRLLRGLTRRWSFVRGSYYCGKSGDETWSLRKEYRISGYRYWCIRYYWRISRQNRTHSYNGISNIVRSMVRSGGLEAL